MFGYTASEVAGGCDDWIPVAAIVAVFLRRTKRRTSITNGSRRATELWLFLIQWIVVGWDSWMAWREET